MQAAYQDIDSVQPKQKSSHLSTSVLDIQYTKANAITDELNLHGMFVKEALDITIKYLDDAVLAGVTIGSYFYTEKEQVPCVKRFMRSCVKIHLYPNINLHRSAKVVKV